MDKNGVLAVVGDREITQNDLSRLLQSLNPQTAQQFRSAEGMKTLLLELVNQELFYLNAVDNGFDKEEQFLEELERVKSGVLKQYALNKVISSAQVNEDEMKDHYEINQVEFSEPKSVKASHILVDELFVAEKILDEIKDGLSFEEAVRIYSSCPSREKGGDLGYFSEGMMVPEFEQAAFELGTEELSAPIKTQFGYHLIKVFDKKEGTLKPFEEVKHQIENQLLEQKSRELYQIKITELKGKYPVKVNV